MKVFIVIFLCLKFCHGCDEYQYTTEEVCNSGEFDCGDDNYTCIDMNKLCDGHTDCENGEDEASESCHFRDQSCTFPAVSRHMSCKLNYTANTTGSLLLVPEFVQGVFTCEPGYTSEMGNSMVSTCIQKTWEPPIFQCLKPCQELNTVNMQQSCYFRKEQVDCNKRLLEGTYVTIACQEPFHAPNYDTTVCMREGTWSIRPEDIKCHPICGHYSSDTLEMLKGKDFPWRVMITENIEGKSQNFFSGTLIDNKLIITDRRAIKRSSKPEDFSITVNEDVGSWGPLRSYKVKDIHFVDQQYRDLESPNDAGNLVVFETTENIEFGFTVFPVCIDRSTLTIQKKHNETAYMVTVGNLNQDGDLDRDNVTILNVISLNHGASVKLTSPNKLPSDQFCGLVNGTPSDTDRGTGLVRKDPKRKLYFLDGVYGVYTGHGKTAMFTFISNYTKWLNEIHNKTQNKSITHQREHSEQIRQAPLSNMLMLFVLLSFVILIAIYLRPR